MKPFLRTAVIAAAIAVMPSWAQTPAPTRPPIEAFGSLPAFSNPALSPDGKYLAMIEEYDGKPIATIRQTDALGAAPVAMPFKDGFIVGVQWAKNRRLLITLNMNKKFEFSNGIVFYATNVKAWYRTVAVDPDGSNPVVLFQNQKTIRDVNTSASVISDLAPDDPDHIYMPLWSVLESLDVPAINSIYEVSVGSGSAILSLRGSSKTIDWVMDGSGHVVARVDRTDSPFTDHLMIQNKKGDWKDVASAPIDPGIGVAGLTQDGSALVMYATDEKTGIMGLVTRSLSDGKNTPLFYDDKYDIGGSLHDPWTGRVIGVSVTADLEKHTYFDQKLADLQRGLEHTFDGKSVGTVTWERSLQKVIVAVGAPRTPPRYYMIDRTTHQAVLLARSYERLQESDLGEMKPYPYKARDGLDIPGYLTLPPGKTAKNLPVVIMPHGGPMARDELSFDWMAQFLANRGYAVLQPNFRGSTGYGKKFQEAGYGQWGLKMQDDITDGVKKLIADGIADPKRICIVGASYGGYAAMAGAAFTPDLYACAAAWAPVTDLKLLYKTEANDYGSDSAMMASWPRFIGDRWSDSAKLEAASPAQHADQIKCPVLLMHGTDDTTVRIDQSQTMESALRRAGKKVTFVSIPHETHHYQSSASRIRWLTELEKFLKENIGN